MRTMLLWLAERISRASVRFDMWLDSLERRDEPDYVPYDGQPALPTLTARTRLPRPARRYDRAQCEFCSREVAIRQDGSPHARRHRCRIVPPTPVTADDVAAIAQDFRAVADVDGDVA